MIDLPRFEGWHLIDQFPEGDPDGVGSWLLHHGGEAMLLEVPPGLTVGVVKDALIKVRAKLRYITASHDHEDHIDVGVWNQLMIAFCPPTRTFLPFRDRGRRLHIGGEQLWILDAPKHSLHDAVTIFRGVAMTGDIELGTLDSVNDEVTELTKWRSFRLLRDFPAKRDYRVHSTVSAHLNDVRVGVDWESLFTVEEPCRS